MPGVRLTRRWAKIARTGDCVYLTNVGIMPVVLSNASQRLMPGGSALHLRLPADLAACAVVGITELAVTITPGLPARRERDMQT